MFHVPFDVLGAVIYGTELVMWIGIMICGVVLGRGEKEPQEEAVDLPQVIEPSRSASRTSVRSQRSGELLSGSDDQHLFYRHEHTFETVKTFSILYLFTTIRAGDMTAP